MREARKLLLHLGSDRRSVDRRPRECYKDCLG